MLKAQFEIEVTTPLFLGGADQVTAELRPPSFRGAMRYWYRALIGGVTGGTLEKVRQREARVFGKSEHGSPIRVRITAVQAPSSPSPAFWQDQNRAGIRYLFWSMLGSSNRSPRQCYPPGTRFTLLLTASEKDQQLLQEAIIALWLLIHCGGVGARSRRCAGSLALRSSTLSFASEISLPEWLSGRARNFQELVDTLTMGFQEIKRFYKLEKLAEPEIRSFDVISPLTCSICVNTKEKPLKSVEDALDAVGRSYQDYRRKLSDRERMALGLPFGKHKGRLASPLHLHITALEQEYVCVATCFDACPKKEPPQGEKSCQWISKKIPL
uniref:CRISPR type III-associated protein domain-containing protein n=1 Tax=Thermogemmatispora argillosa TaxID=2045280 RepID=A0A455SW76_9CHLR|nr:hypothetical protein KTA_08820 [Thermogemmatispora argillosa]